MSATSRVLALASVEQLIVPQVAAGTVNGTGVDCRDYEGIANVLITNGAVAGSGIITMTLQDSADNSSWAAVTSWQTSGVTANMGTANTKFAYPVDLDACRRYLRVVVTLVSGTSVATAAVLAAFKKVSS